MPDFLTIQRAHDRREHPAYWIVQYECLDCMEITDKDDLKLNDMEEFECPGCGGTDLRRV